MLIHSLWHCADSWQEEVQFGQYGQIMEQTLLVPIMNYIQKALKEMDHLKIKN